MELLIRVRDKTSEDFYKNLALTKRGDVIVVKPDGSFWSPRELRNPDWRIVRVTIPRAEAEALLTPEPKISEDHDPRLLRKRAFRLHVDFADLPNGVKDFLRDDTRATPIGTISATRLREIVQQKTPEADPHVVGPSRPANVIG